MEPIVYFKQLVTNHRLSHAYLFLGRNYAEKLTTIQTIAIELVKQKETNIDNKRISQRIKNDQHSDITYIEPEGRFIRVDQIRNLRSWLLTSPVEGDFKIAVILKADTMNQAAQNALLTMLEEPQERVYLFLLADHQEQLLPTIQSRVQNVYFNEVELTKQQRELEQLGLSQAYVQQMDKWSYDLLIQLSEMELNENDINDWFKKVHYFYTELLKKTPKAFVLVQTELRFFLKPVSSSFLIIDYLLILNGQLVKYLTHGQGPINYFLKELVKRQLFELEDVLKLHDALLITRQRIEANVAPQLAIEALTLSH